MFSKVFKANPKGINQYTKGSAESHAAAFKKGVAAGKKGGFSSDAPFPKTDSEHEHFVAGMDEGRSQVSARRKKDELSSAFGTQAQHGLSQKAESKPVSFPSKLQATAKKSEKPVTGWAGDLGLGGFKK